MIAAVAAAGLNRAPSPPAAAVAPLPLQRRAAIARPLQSGPVGPFRSGSMPVLTGPARGVRLAAAHFPFTSVQAHAAIRGSLEVPVQEAFRRTVAPGAVVLDI